MADFYLVPRGMVYVIMYPIQPFFMFFKLRLDILMFYEIYFGFT